MWAAGAALAAALRTQTSRRLAQRAPAQKLAAALSPTPALSDAWGARFASAAAGSGAATPPPQGVGLGRRHGGAGWSGFAGSSLGAEAARCLSGLAGGEASPLSRKKRAPRVGVLNEKTAAGRPKPDERTVADLVRRGWLKSEEEAVALLTRAKSSRNRYAFETAEPAADWLETTLGPGPVKNGLCPAARVVKRDPFLLTNGTASLQRKWDALTLPSAPGDVGIAFSTEQAREAVCKHPQLLGYSVETYKAGWSMLIAAENGLDLTHEKARKCILCDPQILLKENDNIVRRVDMLKRLGYADARNMVSASPAVLNYKEETVKEHAAWWRQTGLDHVKFSWAADATAITRLCERRMPPSWR